MDELPFAGEVCLIRKLPVGGLDPDLPVGQKLVLLDPFCILQSRKVINDTLQSSEMLDFFPASLLGLLELDGDSFRLEKTCEIITSKMYLLLKNRQGFGCSFPLAKCLGILRFFSAHSSSNLFLIWLFTPSRFSGSLFSGLPQCVVCVVGSNFLYQIHVTAGQKTLLNIYFQTGLSVHLESKRKRGIESQEPNFKSRP